MARYIWEKIMKLYMHIGFPKTGTSSIQALLYANKERLANQGICYPEPGTNDLLPGIKGHIFSCELMHRTGRMDKLWTEYREAYKMELESSACPKGIISAENLVYEHSRNIDFWAERFNVIIICYIRIYYDFILSMQKELIKMGFQQTVFTFAEIMDFRILGTLKYQIGSLGRKRFTFLDYNAVKEREGLISSFARLTGIEVRKLRKTENENITFPDYITCFLYQLNRTDITVQEFCAVKKELHDVKLPEYDWYKFNALPAVVFRPGNYARAAFRYQGRLLGDSDWYDKTMARAEKISMIPYMDLTSEMQHRIFEMLSSYVQTTIRKFCPMAGKDRNMPYLPSMIGANS